MEMSGQLHAPAALNPGIESPDTYWIRGWMGPRDGLDYVEKILDSTGTRTPTRR
jgi:hypothetical protein